LANRTIEEERTPLLLDFKSDHPDTEFNMKSERARIEEEKLTC
jgi:hypothetical protein